MIISPLPRHIAIIMDGNGRWAEGLGLPRSRGHVEGSKSVREIVTACREIGIQALTLYAFSAQNWLRPIDEVTGLMELLYDYLESEKPTLVENDIRLQSIGQVHRLPAHVLDRLRQIEEDTKHHSSMVLTLALSYGGREEIIEVMRQIGKEVSAGALDPGAIDENEIEKRMFTNGLPPLDLVVRTSGEMRLSNFLLWQVAYAEIVVTEVPWPKFRKPELYAVLKEYAARERRFGLTGEQVKKVSSA